jgi:glutamate racemase
MSKIVAAPTIIGVFDSGLGGLSVLREIHRQIPAQSTIYFADQSHVPYGSRPREEVRQYSAAITRWLISQGANQIVAACNTASAAALHYLRQEFPGTPFVGMEPAVKPAAQKTHSGVVGVLATPATFQGELYASVVERFASSVTVLQDTCPGLVAAIEAGETESPETRQILEKALLPMKSQGLDTVVLGCTHYPFVIPLIQEIAGPDVQVIDPAPAVARQAARLLEARGLLDQTTKIKRTDRYITTGDPSEFKQRLKSLVGIDGQVEAACWNTNKTGIELASSL